LAAGRGPEEKKSKLRQKVRSTQKKGPEEKKKLS
jgi:hypothetical protein